jgi:hypothetical protein
MTKSWLNHSSQGVPHPRGAYILAFYHCGQEGYFHRECPNEGLSRTHPWPPLGPCSLCKGNHWRSKWPWLQVGGRVSSTMDWWVLGPPVQAPLLVINVEAPQVTIIVQKQNVIFLLDSGTHFSVLPFSPGPQSNNNFIVQGIFCQPLEHCSASGLLLGRPPFLSLFSYSPWDSSALLEQDLLSQDNKWLPGNIFSL